jgi:hypothetical protein
MMEHFARRGKIWVQSLLKLATHHCQIHHYPIETVPPSNFLLSHKNLDHLILSSQHPQLLKLILFSFHTPISYLSTLSSSSVAVQSKWGQKWAQKEGTMSSPLLLSSNVELSMCLEGFDTERGLRFLWYWTNLMIVGL